MAAAQVESLMYDLLNKQRIYKTLISNIANHKKNAHDELSCRT